MAFMLPVANKLVKDHKTKIVECCFVVVVVVMSAVIRLHKIDTAPYGTLVDEASYGYIAYSLLETGKDELGNSLPLTFRAFGDYKMPVYAYTLVPFIKLFGLSSFSVRLPSAISGVLVTYLTYFILRKLRFSFATSILLMLVVAFSPWNIILSRFAFESNVALALFMGSIAFFLSHLQSKNKYQLVLSSVLLGLTWYTYIAYRMSSIGIIILSAIYLTWIKAIPTRNVILFLAVFTIAVSPLIPTIFSTSGTARLEQIGVFSNDSIISEISEFRGLCYKSFPEVVCNVIANRPLSWIGTIIRNISSSLSLEFLFLSGENNLLYLSIPNYGAFFQPITVLFFTGLAMLFGRVRSIGNLGYFLLLVMFALLPTALVGPPQKVRLTPFFPFIVFLFAVGYEHIYTYSRRFGINIASTITALCAISIVGLGLVFSLNMTYVHFVKFSQEYAGPLRGAITEAHANYKDDDVYFASDLHDAIIHYAFYTMVSPVSYQKFAKYSVPDSGNFSHPISYKNVLMQTSSLDKIICAHKQKRSSFVFITPNNLELSGDSLYPPVYRYLSHDGNSSLMQIYYYDANKDNGCKENIAK